MKLLRILAPLFFGVLIYCLVGFYFGPKGVRAMRQLASEKNRLESNIETLDMLNAELRSSLDNLSADPDTISIYAHELGLISEGERLIKLAGFSGGINRKMVPGTALEVIKPTYFPEWGCKMLGFVAFIAMATMLSLGSGKTRFDSHLKKSLTTVAVKIGSAIKPTRGSRRRRSICFPS